jgi:transposase
MRQVIDALRSSLPEPALLVLDGLDQNEAGIILRVHGRKRRWPKCPSCSGLKGSYHSRYHRCLRDLPWQGRKVQIRLRVRRFRCRNRECARKIFAEPIPLIASLRARETLRATQLVRWVGYAVGGLPGSRLLQRLAVPTSIDTVLRRVKAQSRPTQNDEKVRVLGVDDWAWRNQQSYGTMQMDLERRQAVDLLPVRSATSFANWLRSHPGVEIITRDRSLLYADGGHRGAPAAVQIDDRYHLVDNLVEAVENDAQQLQLQARRDLAKGLRPSKPSVEAQRLRCRQARYERYLAVVESARLGETQLAIAAKALEPSAGGTPDWSSAPGSEFRGKVGAQGWGSAADGPRKNDLRSRWSQSDLLGVEPTLA